MESQVGVIPFRQKRNKLEVLLITSRTRGRWIIPKGNVEPHLGPRSSAVQEAFEEAGVEGSLIRSSLGRYVHQRPTGYAMVEVYVMKVKKQHERWPESDVRERQWMSVSKARNRVEEPGLKALLGRLAKKIR